MNEELKSVIKAESEQLSHVAETVDYEILNQLIQLMQKNQKIFLTGCGTSAMAAKKITHTLQVVDRPAFYLNPSDAVHGGIGAVSEGDLVIVISKGGTTKELLSFVENIKNKKAILCSVTENESSPLAEASDLVLKIKVEKEPDAYNMLATASTLAVISVFDSAAIYLEKHSGFSKDTFLINHPSGDVGDRLSTGRA